MKYILSFLIGIALIPSVYATDPVSLSVIGCFQYSTGSCSTYSTSNVVGSSLGSIASGVNSDSIPIRFVLQGEKSTERNVITSLGNIALGLDPRFPTTVFDETIHIDGKASIPKDLLQKVYDLYVLYKKSDLITLGNDYLFDTTTASTQDKDKFSSFGISKMRVIDLKRVSQPDTTMGDIRSLYSKTLKIGKLFLGQDL